MYTSKFITEQLQREPLVVEHSVKHTVVLKPGFQNRRNQSQYLKNSYPAGFQIRDKLTEKLGSSILQDHRSTGYTNPYGSFTDWTKGEVDATDSISADLTDPYADVAGPFLDEMLRNRNLTQKSVTGPQRHSDVVAVEMRLHHRHEKNQPKHTHGHSPPRVRVYNAPALMPTLNPALVHNKVPNNLAPSQTSDYEQWLAFQRSDLGEQYWKIKGNTEGHNYSSHDFTGDRSTVSQLMQGSTEFLDSPPPSAPQPNLGHSRVSLAPIIEIPQPLPPIITVQVHTVNQMIRTDRLSEDKFIVRSIQSDISLAQLKGLITDEIIEGIERTFRLHPGQANAKRPPQRRDYSQVDLNFQCFVPQAGAWRGVNSEVDWVQTKQSCRNEQNVIKLMYALEKKSEFLLLKEIQQSYQRQREEEKLREAPQISLKALTESIEQTLKMKNKYIFTDSPPASPKHGDAGNRSKTGTRKNTPSLPLVNVLKPTNFLPEAHSLLPKDMQSTPLQSPVLSRTNSKKSTADVIGAISRTDSFNDSSHFPSGANSLHGGDSGILPTQASQQSSVSQASRSIFYPKRSDNLDKMYEQLESSIPRQQNFANNLEQRLFRTRW